MPNSSKLNSTLCRALVVHDLPASIMQLAGPELLSLSCRQSTDLEEDEQVLDIPAIASLSALTQLELILYKSCLDCAPLRQLKLKELVLLGCPHIPEILIVPEALIALLKLLIVDDSDGPTLNAYQNDLHTPMSDGYLQAHQLFRMSAISFNLPSLVKLSGKCNLFTTSMAQELNSWHRCSYKMNSLSAYDTGCADWLTFTKSNEP